MYAQQSQWQIETLMIVGTPQESLIRGGGFCLSKKKNSF